MPALKTDLVYPVLVYIVFFAAAFAAGSVPWGYVIGQLFYRRDIRATGSGNIGAMNALRALGKGGALAVLLLDAAKGALPPALALRFGHDPSLAAVLAAGAVLGHCYSPWLNWRGGKGVATSLGAIFAISWPSGLVALAGWLAGALATTYSSVGSMLGSFCAAIALWYFTRNVWLSGYGVFAALFILYTHRENLERLRNGSEKGIPFLRSG